jgi:hypothetical protein
MKRCAICNEQTMENSNEKCLCERIAADGRARATAVHV